jgi:UDP-N-acetylmuramate-alanine ligase
MPNDRSGNCKKNPDVQISKSTLKQSMDELDSASTKGHKCRENVKIWVGEMVCENMKSEVDGMHGKTEKPITGLLGRKVKGCDDLCDS